MITVERTWLQAPVRRIIAELWDHLSDDSPVLAQEYQPRFDEDSRWYLSKGGGGTGGAFWMRRGNRVTWEAHANVRPAFWGDGKGTEHCRKAIATMMEDTGAQKVVATIPTSSPQVLKMAEEIGFVREGVSERSWQKNGVLYDRVHYGITRK